MKESNIPPGDAKRPFWAKCEKCARCWACAYLPMEMGLAGKLFKALRCPMCGAGSKDVRIAKQDNGVLQEPA